MPAEHHGHHHDHDHHHHHADPEAETSPGTQSTLCLPHDHTQSDCRSKGPSQTVDSHADHHHVQRSFKAPGRDLGMMGALLHVLGDALDNVGVIIAAAVIWFTSSPARFYADPAVGMAISLMILCSAGPLIKHSGEILLQSAPEGVSLSDIKHDLEKARLPFPLLIPRRSANIQNPDPQHHLHPRTPYVKSHLPVFPLPAISGLKPTPTLNPPLQPRLENKQIHLHFIH